MDELMKQIGVLNNENMRLAGIEPCEYCDNTGELVSDDIYDGSGRLVAEGRTIVCPFCTANYGEEQL